MKMLERIATIFKEKLSKKTKKQAHIVPTNYSYFYKIAFTFIFFKYGTFSYSRTAPLPRFGIFVE